MPVPGEALFLARTKAGCRCKRSKVVYPVVVPPELDHASEARPDPGRFTTTHWSVVLAAVSDSSPAALGALEQLGRTYCRPLYHYARRRGCDPHEAQDLIQESFRFVLERHVVERADRSRGRFRTVLLTALQNFLANERRQARAAKRRGGQPVLSLDTAAAEVEFTASASESLAPDAAYDRRWALAALDEAMAALEGEYEQSGKRPLWAALRLVLWEDPSAATYAELGQRRAMSEAAVKMAVSRLRRRARELLRQTVANTVADPADIEDEFRHLLAVLRRT